MQIKTTNDKGLFPCYHDNDPLRNVREMENYLRTMFMPLVRKHFPRHYLLECRPDRYRAYLDCYAQTHPYFLYFDIARFYSTITHNSTGFILARNYEELTGNVLPEQLRQYFLSGFNYWFINKTWDPKRAEEEGLLSIVAGLYMLGLCQVLLRWPFLCHHEKFVVLFRNDAEIDECLQQVYLELERLGLQLNQHSLYSGPVFPADFIVSGSAFDHFKKEDEVSLQPNSWAKGFGDLILGWSARQK